MQQDARVYMYICLTVSPSFAWHFPRRLFYVSSINKNELPELETLEQSAPHPHHDGPRPRGNNFLNAFSTNCLKILSILFEKNSRLRRLHHRRKYRAKISRFEEREKKKMKTKMRGGSVRFRVTACFALKRTASVILPVLHNTMRCSLINLYTNLHNHSRTPNFKCPRYTIYIYI